MLDRVRQSNSSADRANLSLRRRFSVWLDSQEVPEVAFARRKAYTLLKLLALQSGHRLHRHQVMDLLWPDLPPRRGAAQLYKVVHHVRRTFATVNLALPLSTLRDIRAPRMKEP